MKHNQKELELKSLANVKCPQCNGPINQLWFESFDWIKKEAHFIAQCWSGKISCPESKETYHIFLIRVPVEAEVDLGEGDS